VTAHDHDTLVEDLTRLGHDLPVPPASAHLATAVMERVATMPKPFAAAPARWRTALSGLGSWQRRAVIAGVALLVALLVTPPVRAAVLDWFGFAGVIVQRGPASGDDAPPPPPVDDRMTVAEAADLVTSVPLVTAELGEPDAWTSPTTG
jgi:hypothetical protein